MISKAMVSFLVVLCSGWKLTPISPGGQMLSVPSAGADGTDKHAFPAPLPLAQDGSVSLNLAVSSERWISRSGSSPDSPAEAQG
jgi:hypothetical protein